MQARTGLRCTLFVCVLTLSGCARSTANGGWLYTYIPQNHAHIKPYDLEAWTAWALFGNDDDGIFGEKTPLFEGDFSLMAALAWQARNPLHNLCFYVIGSADRINDEWDIFKICPRGICLMHYHERAKTVFAHDKHGFYFGLHGLKPFVSLRITYLKNRRLDFYAGWRERGNFGLKFLPFKKIL